MRFYDLQNESLYCVGQCSLNCLYCKEKFDKTPYSTEYLISKINVVLATQDETITLTGGEPTIRKDFIQIFQYCVSHFKYVTLLSNLTGFSNQERLDQFFSLPLKTTTIITTLDSHIPERFNYLTQRIYFDEKVKLIDQFYERRDRLYELNIAIVPTCYNIDHLMELCEFITTRWPGTTIVFRNLQFHGFSEEEIRDLAVPYAVLSQQIKLCETIILYRKSQYYVTNLPFCYAIGFEARLGEVNALKQAYSEPAHIKENLEIYRKDFPENIFIDGCKDCIHLKYCLGIHPGYIKVFGDKEFIGVKGYPLFHEHDASGS